MPPEKGVGILLKPYTNENSKTDTGETALHILAKEGSIDELQVVLDSIDANSVDEKKQIVKTLLQHDDAGWSPLMRALQADKNVKEVSELLSKFIEDNIEDVDVEEMIQPCKSVRTHFNLIYAFRYFTLINCYYAIKVT